MSARMYFLIIIFLFGSSQSETEIGEDLNEELTEFHNVEWDLNFISQEASNCRLHVILVETEVWIGRISIPFVLTVPEVAFASTSRVTDWTRLVQESQIQLFRRSSCQTTFVITMNRVLVDSKDPNQHCVALELLTFRQTGRTVANENNVVLFSALKKVKDYVSRESVISHLCQPLYHGSVINHHILYFDADLCPGLLQWCPALILLRCVHCEVLMPPNVRCPNSSTVLCYKMALESYEKVTENGKSIMWQWESRMAYPRFKYAQDLSHFKPSPIRYRYPATYVCLKDHTEILHNFLIQSLNVSVLQKTLDRGLEDFQDILYYPTFAWTEENPLNSLGQVGNIEHVSAVAICPMETMCSGKTYLRFITKAVAKTRTNAYFGVYTDTFDIYTWMATFVAVIAVTAAICFKAKKLDSQNILAFLQSKILVIWGILMEQVDFPIGPQNEISYRVAVVLAPFVLCFTFMLSNFYRAVLNANYVTAKDDRSQIELLKDIENFTVFIPVSNYFWYKLTQSLKESPDSSNMFHLLNMCLDVAVKGGVDGAVCSLHTRTLVLNDPLWTKLSCFRLLSEFYESLHPINISSYGCDHREAILSVRLLQNMNLFRLDQLDAIMKDNLTQANTALVASHASVLSIWPKFLTVMNTKENREFVHNLHIEYDDSFPKESHQLMVKSSLDPSYTALVTHRAGVLLSSGVWNLWTELAQRNQAEDIDEPVSFRPLSLEHDAIYLIMCIVTCLLGLTTVVYFLEVIISNRAIFKLWLKQIHRFLKILQTQWKQAPRRRLQ